MNRDKTTEFVIRHWDESVIPTLSDYIRIPNKSPIFDPEWEQHGYMERAVSLLEEWCRQQPIAGMKAEIVRLPGRTPLLFIDIPGAGDDVVLLYGHYDKQPEFSGWIDGLEPWTPVLRDGKLYGRGGADDGYAVFGSLTAIRALQEQGVEHPRCVVIIEGCEESGSFDLPHYIETLEDRIGSPGLVICLDAECGNYNQFWCTTSLRGNLVGTLHVDVLSEGVHSGSASGIVPSSFRILRHLLSRVEDPSDGRILVPELHADIPGERRQQARLAAEVLEDSVWQRFPWLDTESAPRETPLELILNNTWRPTLSVTGADGLPALVNAGNVLLPRTTLKLSFRLPPTCEPRAASRALKATLEANPPPFVKVRFDVESTMGGWDAPPVADWLESSIKEASETWFGQPSMYMGTGGSIPFMGMLGEKFPEAQFLVTGLLGPRSNAHGPNEFLHIETGKRLTCCVSKVLEDYFQRT
ncbi:MAG TPA: M20 family metallopeptidase [Woeseiaceae bacterium]|nr:M20 family metallopeptidase [Woeseiaceae bacterium]